MIVTHGGKRDGAGAPFKFSAKRGELLILQIGEENPLLMLVTIKKISNQNILEMETPDGIKIKIRSPKETEVKLQE